MRGSDTNISNIHTTLRHTHSTKPSILQNALAVIISMAPRHTGCHALQLPSMYNSRMPLPSTSEPRNLQHNKWRSCHPPSRCMYSICTCTFIFLAWDINRLAIFGPDLLRRQDVSIEWNLLDFRGLRLLFALRFVFRLSLGRLALALAAAVVAPTPLWQRFVQLRNAASPAT